MSNTTPARLRALKDKNGWTLDVAAAYFGVNRYTMSRWINGRQTLGPSAELLLRAYELRGGPQLYAAMLEAV